MKALKITLLLSLVLILLFPSLLLAQEKQQKHTVTTLGGRINYFSKWVGLSEPAYELGNGAMYQEGSTIFVRPTFSPPQPITIMDLGGMLNLKKQIRYNSDIGKIVWGSEEPGSFYFEATNPEHTLNIMTLNGENGNVGIGLTNPDANFEVFGEYQSKIKLSDPYGNLQIAIASEPWDFAPESQPGDVIFKTHNIDGHHGIIFNINDNYNDGSGYIKFGDYYNHTTMTILNNGKIGIGTDSPDERLHVNGNILMDGNVGIGTSVNTEYKLTIAGKILAQELKISLDVPSSDYVFYDDYDLKSLSEVESYIDNHNHLPDVPSAAEFKENGYNVGEMDDLLLRKIEELTLYLIEQQKIIDKQQKDISLLKKIIEKK